MKNVKLKETKGPKKVQKKERQSEKRTKFFVKSLFRKDWTAAGLFLFALFLCWLFVLRYGVFGSSIDWISQHSTLADYFRKRFYATGNLFPEFAWNLGGGQNIYNFAYYGLFSPVVLLSCCFPFIPMDLWVMGSSAVLYAADAELFYLWLRKKGLHYGTCLFASLFFTGSTALLYHSYNQLMFVNYMPFLILALMGADRHFQKRKSGLLILAVLGMILTSFYFSVGGLLALTAYAVTEYFKCYAENTSDAAEEEKRSGMREKNGAAGKNQKACEKAAGRSDTAMAGFFPRSNPFCISGFGSNPAFMYSADSSGRGTVRQQRRRTRQRRGRNRRTLYRPGDVETAVSDSASLLYTVRHRSLSICRLSPFWTGTWKKPVS